MIQFSNLQLSGINHGITQVGDTAPDCVMGEQIHKDVTTWVKDSSQPMIKKADALMTRASGVTLGVRTADCVPMLFAEPKRGVVGTIHAGWRGTALEISRKAIDALRFAPNRVLVGVGPAICPDCFEVGEEVAAQFDRDVVTEKDGKWHVDLWQANVNHLKDAGVPERNIEVLRVCTLEDDRFFSFRGGERERRNIAWIENHE
jgi:hypothetical protein